MDKLLFGGYVDRINGEGVHTVEIYKDDDFYYAYVNGELADDVTSPEEFEDTYGFGLYTSLKEYRAENGALYDIYDFWPQSIID